MTFYHILYNNIAQEIQQFLGSAYCKSWNHHIAAFVKGFLNGLCQFYTVIFYYFVKSVTVGAFAHDIVGIFYKLRVFDKWLVDVAHITREHNSSFNAVFFYFYLDSRRAYKMTYIVEYNCNTRHNLCFLLVCHAAEHTQNHLRIIAGIKRLYLRLAASLVFSAFPFSFGFLDVCRVHNHNMAQVYSSFGTPNLAVETAFCQQWQVTCVVNVGVGYQHSVNFIYRNRHIIADILFPALAHAPVDKYVFAAGLEQMGRTCDTVSCSYKL